MVPSRTLFDIHEVSGLLCDVGLGIKLKDVRKDLRI